MGVDFTVFKGSSNGDIVEAKGQRDPKPTEVIVKISHCGVCGTDEHYRHADQGLGHEGIGTIIEVGANVQNISDFKIGDRVGMGWFHKFCGHCKSCLTGRQHHCINATSFGTADQDQGGFGTAVAWDVSALYHIPEQIASEHAGPLMCGGVTVWEPLYNGSVKPGSRVGILGVGGLGHLAIQFVAKMGFEPVVFSSTDSKREQALKFGASEFHVTGDTDNFAGITRLDLLLITTNATPNLSQYLVLMAPGARLVPLTISPEPLALSSLSLIMGGLTVVGSAIGASASMQAMLAFAAKHGIKPQIEKFPLTQGGVTEAMQKLRDGKMRYRGVLVV